MTIESLADRLLKHTRDWNPVLSAMIGKTEDFDPEPSGWENIVRHVEEMEHEKEQVAKGLCPWSGMHLHTDGEGVPGSMSCDVCDCFGFTFKEVVGDVKLERQYECFVVGKGWVCNPIADDVVSIWRQRWVSKWTRHSSSGDRSSLPYHVQKAMGVYYDEETDRWGTLSTGGTR